MGTAATASRIVDWTVRRRRCRATASASAGRSAPLARATNFDAALPAVVGHRRDRNVAVEMGRLAIR